MRLQLLQIWRAFHSSYWFLPSLMAVLSVVAAFGALLLDRHLIPPFETPPFWLVAPGPDAARAVLATIAGSMITVAGVAFSIVIVALTVASSQFGPRLLSPFLQDTGNQVTLGTFVSVFLYCLIVLLHLPATGSGDPLPHLSVLLAVISAVISLGVLIFFFDHISASLQAGSLVLESRRELERVLKDQYPEERPQGTAGDWPDFQEPAQPIPARRNGYVSRIDEEGLVELAQKFDLRLRMEVPVGTFVLKGQPLVSVTPAERATEEVCRKLQYYWVVVRLREQSEDLALAVDRLAEMAVRALSPGINDPYTACASIDRLVSVFAQVITRPEPVTTLHDENNAPRLLRRLLSFEQLLARAFDPIRRYGQDDPHVISQLLEGMRRLRQLAERDELRGHLDDLIAVLRYTAESNFDLERDRRTALGENHFSEERVVSLPASPQS